MEQYLQHVSIFQVFRCQSVVIYWKCLFQWKPKGISVVVARLKGENIRQFFRNSISISAFLRRFIQDNITYLFSSRITL